MPKSTEIAVEDALAVIASLADSDEDEARVKGIREWVCRKLGVPYHDEIEESVEL